MNKQIEKEIEYLCFAMREPCGCKVCEDERVNIGENCVIRQALTEAYQAGIDEAVEVLEKRVMELQKEWKSQEEEHGLANQGTIDRCSEAKLNRDTIKALQDNK